MAGLRDDLVRRAKSGRRTKRAALRWYAGAQVVQRALRTERGQTVPVPRDLVSMDDADLDFQEVVPGERVERSAPIHLPEHRHQRFTDRRVRDLAPLGVAVLPQGRVLPRHQLVIDRKGRIVDTLTTPYARREERYDPPQTHPALDLPVLPPTRHLRGRALLLTSPGGPGYFHFLFEVMTKLSVFEFAGMTFDDVDHVVLNSTIPPHTREMARHYGIDRRKFVDAHTFPHLTADEWVIPTQSEFGEVPTHLPGYLRQRFPAPDRSIGGASERIYVPRTGTAHRHVSNEAAVRQVLARHGFRSVQMDRMKLGEKSELLSRTSVLLGTHGGGMTNLMFCPPGATAIVINHPDCVTSSLWAAAHVSETTYAYLVSRGPFDPRLMENTGRAMRDIAPDPEQLDQLLGLVLDGEGRATRRTNEPSRRPDPSAGVNQEGTS